MVYIIYAIGFICGIFTYRFYTTHRDYFNE